MTSDCARRLGEAARLTPGLLDDAAVAEAHLAFYARVREATATLTPAACRAGTIWIMPGALATLLPLITAAVLIASAGAKFRHPDDLAGWEELGVAEALRKPVLLRLHPWGEVALAFALAVFGGVLGLLAALVALVLMASYLWLVVRAFRREDDASCACFGTRKQITGLTVARNVWLTLLAAATLAVIWMNPLVGGAVASAAGAWAWIAGAAIAAVTATVVVWSGTARPSSPSEPATAGSDVGGAGELDYVRLRTPAVPVTLADGTVVESAVARLHPADPSPRRLPHLRIVHSGHRAGRRVARVPA